MITRTLFLTHLVLATSMGHTLAQGDPPPVIFQAVYLSDLSSQVTSTFEGGYIDNSYPVTMRKVPTQWAHRLRRVEIVWEVGSPTQPGDHFMQVENVGPTPIPGYPPDLGWYTSAATQFWLTWVPTTVRLLALRPDLRIYGSGVSRGTGDYLPARSATDGADWAGPDSCYWSAWPCADLAFITVNVTQPTHLRKFLARGNSEWITPFYMSPREMAGVYNVPANADIRWRGRSVARWGVAFRVYYHFQ